MYVKGRRRCCTSWSWTRLRRRFRRLASTLRRCRRVAASPSPSGMLAVRTSFDLSGSTTLTTPKVAHLLTLQSKRARRTEMYAGRVACCPLVSHGEYDDGRDRRTNARCRCITISSRRGQRNKPSHSCNCGFYAFKSTSHGMQTWPFSMPVILWSVPRCNLPLSTFAIVGRSWEHIRGDEKFKKQTVKKLRGARIGTFTFKKEKKWNNYEGHSKSSATVLFDRPYISYILVVSNKAFLIFSPL